jgi:ElaB/YqjD/DUF883 family membrane-anchored ribosome-binding protein
MARALEVIMESELDTGVGTGSGNGQDIKDMAASKLEDLREWGGEALDRVERLVRERPTTAVIIALGAGFVIGRLARRL